MYLHLPHLLLKVVQLFLETSSNSDIDLQKEQFKDESNSRLPATPTLGRAALSRGLAGGPPEFNSDYLRHWPSPHLLFNLPLPLCHTATHVFVNNNQMSSEVYFLQIWKMYFLLNIVRIFSLQGPSLTTAPIDASYDFTSYLDEWVFEKAADRHEAVKEEAKKGDLAEVGFALVDP